jgi:hypothetical protein
MDLTFVKDICDNNIVITKNNQKTMNWILPYIDECINMVEPKGSVLEIGFGVGYSATKICSHPDVRKYTVIEYNPMLWDEIESWKIKMNLETNIDINLIKGRWQDVLQTLGKYDSIYFDNNDNKSSIHEIDNNINNFMCEILQKHVNINCRIYNFNTPKENIYTHVNCMIFECYDYKIPDNCKNTKVEELYIPIYTVISEPDFDLNKKIFESDDKRGAVIEKKDKTQNVIRPRSIYCNLLVIDNFYSNAMETREFILTQEFLVRGNYPGQRTISFANQDLKNIIEGYIGNFAGKIIDWPEGNDTYNGAFQYTTSRDKTWIHTDAYNNWAGVLYLTPDAPVSSGTRIYRYNDGTRFEEDKIRNNKDLIDKYSQDYTKWEVVDQLGNIFNRLILFNSKQFHASQDYFGTSKEDGRLFQVFFFSTEK